MRLHPSYSPLYRWREVIISAKWAITHSIIGRHASRNDKARGVRSYSTRGGTSAYTVRRTKPSSSNRRNVCVSTFCEISGKLLWKYAKAHRGTALRQLVHHQQRPFIAGPRQHIAHGAVGEHLVTQFVAYHILRLCSCSFIHNGVSAVILPTGLERRGAGITEGASAA